MRRLPRHCREKSPISISLAEPSSASGRAMDGQAIPDFCGCFRAVGVHQRLAAMDVDYLLPGGSGPFLDISLPS